MTTISANHLRLPANLFLLRDAVPPERPEGYSGARRAGAGPISCPPVADEQEIEERLAWVEASVRRIAGSVSPPVTLPAHPSADAAQLSDAVKELITSGKAIQAIQLHRQETGAGLAEAKTAIESYSG